MLCCVVYMVIRDPISKVISYAFLMYWSIAIILSEIRPFGFFKVHDETYLIILVGITSFIIGMCLYRGNITRKYEQNIPSLEIKINSFIRNKWLAIFILIVSLYEAQFIPAALAQTALDSSVITEDRLDVMFQGNSIGLLLSIYVLRPLFHVVAVIVAYVLIKRKRIPFLSWVAYITFFCIFGILNGGRALFIIFLIYVIFEYIILNPIKFLQKIKFKTFLIIGLLGSCIFIGMMHMTNYRLYGTFEIEDHNREEIAQLQSDSFIKYSVLPIVLFDYSLQHDYFNKFGGYKYGRMTFSGADVFVRGIARKIGVKDYQSTEEIVLYLQDNWVQCTPTKQYNYAYTAFFYNYQDFGIFGVIILPIIFGYLMRKIVFRYYMKPTVPLFIFINLCFYLVIFTVFTDGLNNLWIYAYLFYLFIAEIIVKNRGIANKKQISFISSDSTKIIN